ncbi:MEDS domain-containing protein [Mesorhizobium sp. ES1-4]|uniref:MEDS domain-containing protein n=1 Tax=Mesorhizobium sp. ES1-4 TaxID=2876627 RepID=UPI001CCF4B97|nr:MEDS domain-containing protein [Mesorhizobium sp. ES1-4]MBZ9795477.1 MEDS domain-containing protein [Mesorhizobium sp. ES1-4]
MTQRHSLSSEWHSGEEAGSQRKSGISVLGETSWGMHMCVFYETAQDLLDANIPYFQAGLENNEFCLWAISDPITAEGAADALRASIPDIDKRLSAGQIEVVRAAEWYTPKGEFELKRIIGSWNERLRKALAKGYDGIRISGNAFWLGTDHWEKFCEYERDLDRSVAGQKMLVLCTYSMAASGIVDLLEVARAHQGTIIRQNNDWEFLEPPELRQSKQQGGKPNGAPDTLPNPFPGHDALTARERIVLAQIAKGHSSKEIARALNIAPRTVEFHRENLIRKTGARSTVDLLRIVLSD